jgi:hypothetical protein
MNIPTWTRVRGTMLLLGALAGVLIMAIHPDDIRDPLNGPLHFAYLFTSFLVVLGLQGPIDRLRGRAGVVASVGFLALAFFILLSEIGHSVLYATIVPVLVGNPSTTDLVTQGSWLEGALFAGPYGIMMTVGTVGLFLGVLAVAVGTLIEGGFPRWPAVVLVLGSSAALLPFAPGPVGPALLYVALAGFGYATLSGAGRERVPQLWRRGAAKQSMPPDQALA